MTDCPHDKIVHQLLTDVEHAGSFLRAVLPADVSEMLDFSTLETHGERFVDEKMREFETDLLFSVKIAGHHGLVYTLLEHQSTPDPKMAWRLLRYVVLVVSWWEKNHPDAAKFPLVLPVVLYNGQRRWSAALNFRDLVDIPDGMRGSVKAFVPDFSYLLEDLSKRSDEDLRQLALTGCMQFLLRALKNIHEPKLGEMLQSWAEDLRSWLGTAKGLQDLHLVLQYIAVTSEAVETGHFRDLGRRLGPAVERLAMTLAERLRAEGREKGREEGIRTGQQRLLLRQLQLRFGPDLQPSVVSRIADASESQLETWAERVLTSNSLDKVFE